MWKLELNDFVPKRVTYLRQKKIEPVEKIIASPP